MSTGLKKILVRVGVFLGLFVLVTGIIGPWVVASKLLYGYGFYIYGNLGKMVIYGVIVFGLLIRNKVAKITAIKIDKPGWRYLAGAVALLPVFFYLGSQLLSGKNWESQIPLTILVHGLIIAIPALILIFVFGPKFLKEFIKLFKKEIGICGGIAVVFDVLIFQVWKLWPIFSAGVLNAVSALFRLTYSNVRIIPPRVLFVNKFGVEIAEACSGLDSLFMFSALYILIGILDWKKFNKPKYLLAFPLAAIGLYLVNILRVYLLVLIGVEISPQLALKLFHTYAGMFLFIGYFAVFWGVFYKRLQK